MKIDLYVDGSFSKDDQSTAYGGFIILADGKPIYGCRCVTHSGIFTSMNNVGGELIATMMGVAAVLGKTGCQDINLHYDYKGIACWISEYEHWNASKPGSKYYVSWMASLKKRYTNLNIRFHKVKAHTGNVWNEVADTIAGGDIPSICKDVIEPRIIEFIC